MSDRPCTRLWLHIGLPKTGTSYLQSALCRNRRRLLDRGVLYPHTGERGGGHALLAWPLLSEQRQRAPDVVDPAANPSELWQKLREEAGQASASQLVLSSEYFSEAERPGRLKKMCDQVADSVQVVIYLRRQDELAESGYNQSVKSGHRVVPFDAKNYSKCYDWKALLDRWSQCFGADNLVIRVFDRATRKLGILADFGAVLGVDVSDFGIDQAEANTRLHPALVEFQRVANALGVKGTALSDRLFSNLDGLRLAECRSFLTDDDRATILGYYEQSNRAVAVEYLGRENGVLFDPLEATEATLPRAEVDRELLSALILTCWESLNERIGDLQTQIDRSQSQSPSPQPSDETSDGEASDGDSGGAPPQNR